jgi:hypothetical protein
MDTNDMQASNPGTRRPWEPPTMRTVGTVGEVLRAGGGKLAISAVDTGEEARKPMPSG